MLTIDMDIINANKYSVYNNKSFILKLKHNKELVLFNCGEGLQSYFIQKKIKINHLSVIILTDLHINNISGLLGLLSSLNSIGRTKILHIYGPQGLAHYLDSGKKYSHTNFKYGLYIHILNSGLIISHSSYRIYAIIHHKRFQFIIVSSEQLGKFTMSKTKKYYMIPGPLYSSLKKGYDFILPDGLILDGVQFTDINYPGNKFLFILDKYYSKEITLNSFQSTILLYKKS